MRMGFDPRRKNERSMTTTKMKVHVCIYVFECACNMNVRVVYNFIGKMHIISVAILKVY